MKKSVILTGVGFVLALGLSVMDAAPAMARHDPWERHHGYGHHEPRGPYAPRGWDAGYWYHGPHAGRQGWWWVTGSAWSLYPRRMAAIPSPAIQPIYVVQQPAVIVQQPAPSVVIAQQPSLSAIPMSATYADPNGRACREYQSTVYVGGHPQPAYGTACQQGDGSWRVIQ